MKMRVSLIIVFFLSSFLFAQQSESGEIEFVEKSFWLDRKADTIRYELGAINVPENREKAESRIIKVGFLRIKSSKNTVAPPVFCLPGGPGGSLIERFMGSGNLWNQIEGIESFLEFSDVVIVDQRGHTAYGEMLLAYYKELFWQKGKPLTVSDQISHFESFSRKTVRKFERKNKDLSGYTVIQCSKDVNDLRKALGYEKISLYGGSFGSQWSFAIMRLYPEIVERAVLSGVEPLNNGYDMPSHVFAAVKRMWEYIDKDPKFKPYLPEGGMSEAAKIVAERLQKSPIKVNKKIVLGPEDFPWNQPHLILLLYHDEKEKFASEWVKRPKKFKYAKPIIGPLIDISLGVTAEREKALRSDTALMYIGHRNFAPYIATEEIWPSPDVGDDFRKPIQSDIPVLFVQGDWDTSTPIENTYEIAPYFDKSHILVVERGGHVVFNNVREEFPSVWKKLNTFLKTGEFDDLPERVRLKNHRTFRTP